MGMSSPKKARRGRIANATVAEINVTPLVDVMLVLLVIFMTASAVETARLSREAETLRQVVSDEDEVQIKSAEEQQVPIDLPKAQAEKISAGNSTKPVLSIDGDRRIYFRRHMLVNCGRRQSGFKRCLDRFEKALSDYEPAHGVKDVHFRADKGISYGEVLQVMARMRRAGISRFGLVSEAEPGK